jgi:hypothetical protein
VGVGVGIQGEVGMMIKAVVRMILVIELDLVGSSEMVHRCEQGSLMSSKEDVDVEWWWWRWW